MHPILSRFKRPTSAQLRRLAIEAAVFLALVAAIGAWQGRNLLGSGGPAPQLALRDLRGSEVRLDQFRGRKVLLYFWAPWCGVCKLQTPTVNGLADEETAVLAVALSYESVADVQRYASDNGLTMPVLLGTEQTARDFNVSVYPTIYVIDEEGRIEHAVVGYATGLGLRLRLL